MPLYGSLDITQSPASLPTLANLDTEAWTLPKAEMMQLLIEVPRTTTESLLPKAMHPALPSYVILAVTKYPESPVGPFNLAVLRLGSRAGAHPRGFLLGAVASSAAAAEALRTRWGFPVEAGEVKFLRRHDRVMGTVSRGGMMLGFATSPEFNGKSIDAVLATEIYGDMQDRAPTLAEYDAVTRVPQADLPDLIYTTILSSAEYRTTIDVGLG